MKSKATIVISDLHISSGILDNVDDVIEENICRFIQSLSEKSQEVELVLNGDCFDFILAPPTYGPELTSTSKTGLPLCFTEHQSMEKLCHIYNSHKRIFSLLHEFIRSHSGQRLVIMPGNHDVDFFWQSVRDKFVDFVIECQSHLSNRIRFHLEQVYWPEDFPDVWIEHGQQHDRCNCFKVDRDTFWSAEKPPIFADNRGIYRLYECIGTRFLLKYANQLNDKYPFIDNVKPFSRFFNMFALSALHPDHGPCKATAAVWGMLRYLITTVLDRPADLASTWSKEGITARTILDGWINGMHRKQRERLQANLRRAGFANIFSLEILSENRAGELLDFVSEHLEVLDGVEATADDELAAILIEGDLPIVNRLLPEPSAAQIRVAVSQLTAHPNISFCVMGHTHLAQDRPQDLSYINTGCWIRYLDLAQRNGSRPSAWRLLSPECAELYPCKFHYVEIRQDRSAQVKLRRFTGS